MQHLAPPKSETDPPLPVIAKNPIPETSFLSKFKQAKSKFKERLEKKRKIPPHKKKQKNLPPHDQIKSTKRKKITTPPVQHQTPPKSKTDPPPQVIAKNPLSETIFLSKSKQAKSKFEERLENKNKNTTPQSKKKPQKKENCKKTPPPPST